MQESLEKLGAKSASNHAISSEHNFLSLIAPTTRDATIRGYGFQSRIARILEVLSQDPEVDHIVKALSTLMNKTQHVLTTNLASQLQSSQSVSTEILSSYLQWIGHRGAKEKAASEEDQNEARNLDSAFLKTRVNAIIDLILTRVIDLNLIIPETIKVDLTSQMLLNWKEENYNIEITLAPSSKKPHTQSLAAIDSILNNHGGTRNEDPNESGSFTCNLNKNTALKLNKLATVDHLKIEIKIAESFFNLFHGGASRIQDRANNWWINNKVADLYETERALTSGSTITNQELFKAIWSLNELDGATSIGYQGPIQSGQTRRVGNQTIDRDTLPEAIQTSALILPQGNSLSTRERKEGHLNILQQSPLAQRAVSKMEEKIATLPSNSLEFVQSVDVLNTYSAAMLYNSHHLWQSQGVLDRLLEVSVTVGSQKHREAATDFLTDGMDQIASILYKDFQGKYRQVYLALMNLILTRENWDTQTLDFIFDKLEWLQNFQAPQEMTTIRANQAFAEIISTRREEHPNNSQVLEVLKAPLGTTKVVEYASYRMKLEIKAESINGQKGKILEVHYPEASPKNDTEELYHIYNIGELAAQEGFIAIQLVGWPYNPAKDVRDTEEYLEISTAPDGNQRNRGREEPVFIRNLSPRNLEETKLARGSFSDYMKTQFNASYNIDLSAESALLGQDAHRYKQNHGGKAMGIALLTKLLDEFADKRLQILPQLNCNPKDLLHGVKIPDELFQKGNDFSDLICRSNAAFEYGCPPGILDSVGKLKVPENKILQLDLLKLKSGFSQVLNQYELDSRISYQVLIQPQLHPRASGIVYSSFTGNKSEATIIEASLGPPISATTGLANLLHYRVQNGKIASYRNFEGETPSIIFHEKSCLLDRSEDPSRRELDLYQSISDDIQGLRFSELKSLWQANTFKIPSEPYSPLKLEELELLNKFAKFAESKLKKPLKLEFGVGSDGTVYILQLDPAMLEVNEANLTFDKEHEGIIVETPFVNMPFIAEGLDVLVEIAASGFTKIPEGNFLFVAETTPLNINIQNELAKPFPQCLGIITPSGSRMNHCYSEARTFIPMLGFIGIGDAMRKVMANLKWGDNPGLKMDIKSDGRWGRVRIYQDKTAL